MNKKQTRQAQQSLKAAYNAHQWLGVAYAHIPTRDACKPFARLAYILTHKKTPRL